MLSYAFHRFAMRREFKPKSHGKQVELFSEAGTSLAAIGSGGGKNDRFECIKVDRDTGGTRGIVIRTVGDTPCSDRACIGWQAEVSVC